MRFRLPAALVLAIGLAVPAWAETGPQITVTGEGVVELPPDMATLRLGVVSEARNAADALASNSADMAAVLAFLADAGVAETDIQTSGLTLMPRQDRDAQGRAMTVGFMASNQVTVRVRDLGRLGGLMDAVVREGANRFDGLQFGLSDMSAALAEARIRAVADARAKAETYSAAAGVTLGPIMTIADQSGGFGPMEMRMVAAAADAVPIAAGALSVTAGVTITWALAP